MKIIIIVIILIILFFKFSDPIFDLIMEITLFFEGIADFFTGVKSNAKGKKQEQIRRKADKERKEKENDQYMQYQNFEREEELPNDIASLIALRKKFSKNGDEHRAFLCLKKSVDLDKGTTTEKQELKDKLAEYYYRGIGTERNLELARKYQAESFISYIKSAIQEDEKIVAKINDIWMGKYPADPECLYLVAKELCEQRYPIGVFLLEDVMLAKNNGITMDTAKSQQKEIFQKLTGNAYALYHLWCMDEKEKGFLERSAELGCYYAAVKLKKKDLVQKLKANAGSCLAQGFASACEYVSAQSEDTKQSKVLFEQGRDAYLKDKNNKNAIRQVEEAAELGNEQASLWLIQYKAENGDKEAEYELAALHEQGTYWVEKNKEKAAMLYMRSAIQGYAEAQYRYGQMLEEGELGTPKNEEQADIQYMKAADQGYEPACMKIGVKYSRGNAEKKAIAEKYLKQIVKLDHSVEGNAKHVKEAWYTLMQLYRNYEFHVEPYPNLGKAFICAVEYIRLAEAHNKAKMGAIEGALAGNADCVDALASGYISKIQDKEISEKDAAIVIPVYETFVLQKACIYETLAEAGDIAAMRNLFFLYDEVGSYSLYQTTGISIMTLRFAGNRERGRYWLDKAISLGDVRAMRYKGEYYYIYGIGKEEGEEYLEMAARRGDSIAAEDLEIKQLEVETQARYRAEAQRLAESLGIGESGSSENDESGPIPIEWMPEVITGPYGHKYRLVVRGAHSAEYENVDSGVHVTITESQIGMTGSSASTGDEYFHW